MYYYDLDSSGLVRSDYRDRSGDIVDADAAPLKILQIKMSRIAEELCAHAFRRKQGQAKIALGREAACILVETAIPDTGQPDSSKLRKWETGTIFLGTRKAYRALLDHIEEMHKNFDNGHLPIEDDFRHFQPSNRQIKARLKREIIAGQKDRFIKNLSPLTITNILCPVYESLHPACIETSDLPERRKLLANFLKATGFDGAMCEVFTTRHGPWGSTVQSREFYLLKPDACRERPRANNAQPV